MQTFNRQPGPGCRGREVLYPTHWLGVCKPILIIVYAFSYECRTLLTRGIQSPGVVAVVVDELKVADLLVVPRRSHLVDEEIQRLEDDVRGAIAVRCLELITNIAIRREAGTILP